VFPKWQIRFHDEKPDWPRAGRAEREHKKDTKDIITRSVTENTKDGPRQRIIGHVPPFDKRDRKKDYGTAWAFLTEKFAREPQN
jgi:hypothetical protein